MTVNAGSPLSPLPSPYVHSPRFLMVLKSASIGIINAAPPMIMHRKEKKKEADTHRMDWRQTSLLSDTECSFSHMHT